MAAPETSDAAPRRTSRSRYTRYREAGAWTAPGWTIETVVEPAPLFGANGIRVDRHGNCWIAEFRGGSISLWDAEHDVLSLRIPQGGGFAGPDDIAFDAAGNAYVPDYGDGCVVGVRPDGTLFNVLDDSPDANGVAVDRQGRVFVDEFRGDGRLLELDPLRPNRPRVILENLAYPNALERGPDGRLYYQDVLAGEIHSVDPDRRDARKELDGFLLPSAVKFDSRGRLVVAESVTGRVHAIDLAGAGREVIGTVSPGIDNCCFDAAGRLYVSSNVTGRVVRFDARGTIDRQTGAGFVGPCGIAGDGEDLIVADILRIARVRPSGETSTIWQLTLPGPLFTARAAVPVASDRIVVATPSGDVRMLDLTRNTAEVTVPAQSGAGSGDYRGGDAPTGTLCLARSDDGAIAGRADGELLELDRNGRQVERFWSGLGAVTAVARAAGVTAACDRRAGSLMILDAERGNARVANLRAPDALAISPEAVYVVESEARTLTRVTRDGLTRSVVAGELPLGNPLPVPRGERQSALCVESSGTLVIACDGDGSLRRLQPPPSR